VRAGCAGEGRLRQDMVKSGLLLGFGNLSGALLSLARNLLIAGLLAPEEFGIASTFALTLALLEMLSNLGVNQLIVQAEDGEEPVLQAGLHGVQLLRGLVAAGLLLLLAEPYATLLGAPQALWAYRAMALVPLLRGLWHLDIFRRQRRLDLRNFVTATVVSQALALAAIWPLAAMDDGYEVMLWSILLQQGLFALLSHAGAERPFTLRFDGQVLRRTLRFGLPLLGNGLLLYAIFHGDRIIVGNQLGMESLGWFSLAAMLTLTPSMILASTLQSLFLPQLARVQSQPEAFAAMAAATQQAAIAAGAALAVFAALLGPGFLLLLFGQTYAPSIGLFAWLAIMQAARLVKAGPTIVAIARGQTTNPLIANTFRAAVIPAAWLALIGGAGIVWVIWLGILGEVLATAASLLLLRRRISLGLRPMVLPLAAMAALLSLVGLAISIFPPGSRLAESLRAEHAILLLALMLLPLALPDLRRLLRVQLR